MTTTTRRAVLAGTAAIPALALPALALPAFAAEAEDPAIAAVRAWLDADEAERAYYRAKAHVPDDDPAAAALGEATSETFDDLIETPPTTAAGLALALAAVTYDEDALAAGHTFGDPETWFFDEPEYHTTHQRALCALWGSPAAAEVFGMLGRRPARGAAFLPVAGAAGAAAAAGREDPAVVAYRAWRDASRNMRRWYDATPDYLDDDPEQERLHAAEWDARKRLAETIATTPAGIAGQLRLAFDIFHNQGRTGGPDHPESYTFDGWKDDLDGSVLRNLLTAADRLAGAGA